MTRRPMKALAILACVALPLLGGCYGGGWRPFTPASGEARLAPVQGQTANGKMTFTMQGRELLIQGDFAGLAPGAHGLHIHEAGNCGGPAARNAGGHLNPTGARHGSPGSPSHHLGDLPMLTAGAEGTAHFQARMSGLRLDYSPSGVFGRAVIVTARPDNFTTQPDGNSGPAVACGVIEAR